MIENNNQAQLEQTNDVETLLQQKDFGTPLRLAREAAGLSVEEVAEKLIVSTDIIKAIDGSKADALPALTFTQGYIRNYARMLDVSADEIIEAYSTTVPDTKKVTTPQSVLLVHKTGSDAFVKFISVVIIFAAIIGLFAWLYQSDLGLNLKDSQTVAEIYDDITDQSVEAPRPQLEFRTEQQQEQTVLDQSVDSEEPLSITTIDDAAMQQPVAIDEESQNKEVFVAQAEQPPAAVEVITPENLVTGDDVLLLTAQGDSWCEIQDANGHRLYYQLIASGEEVNVRGQAPFRVFLGNAPDVRIEINSEIVSFDHLINNNSKIANLNIDKDATAARFRNR